VTQTRPRNGMAGLHGRAASGAYAPRRSAVIAFAVSAEPSFRVGRAEGRPSRPLSAHQPSALPARARAWSDVSRRAWIRQAYHSWWWKASLAEAVLPARGGRWFAPLPRARSRKAPAPPQALRTRRGIPSGAFCRSTTSLSPTNDLWALTGAGRHRSREPARAPAGPLRRLLPQRREACPWRSRPAPQSQRRRCGEPGFPRHRPCAPSAQCRLHSPRRK
jgi:hypothetical protein